MRNRGNGNGNGNGNETDGGRFEGRENESPRAGTAGTDKKRVRRRTESALPSEYSPGYMFLHLSYAWCGEDTEGG